LLVGAYSSAMQWFLAACAFASVAITHAQIFLGREEDKTVHYTLEVTTCHLQVGDLSTWTRCYNGTVPGPTLRVKPGQIMTVSLVNTLSAHGNEKFQILNITGFGEDFPVSMLEEKFNKSSFQAAQGTGSLFGTPNTTNLHVHGLVVSAASPADDVMMEVKPGSVFEYVYHVPSNHMGGTGWYHPHSHHSTANQANGGMFGALLIEDPPASLPPSVMQAEDRLVLVDTLDVQLQRAVARMSMDDLWQTDSNATVTLVNGTLEPTSTVQSGVWYRFRFVYASMFSSIRLSLKGKSESTTCQMELVAKDGIYLNEAPRTVNRIWLSPGNRADVMVSCSCAGAGSCQATFRSEWGPRDAAEWRSADDHFHGVALTRTWVGDVFHLDINGQGVADALPRFKPNMPCYLADLTRLDKAQLSPSNQVDVNMFWEEDVDNGLSGERADEYDARYHSLIKGQFGMDFNKTHNRFMHDDQKAAGTLPFDEVQEWTVRGTEWHPFHVHGQPFQLTALPSKEEMIESLFSTYNFDKDTPLNPYINATMWSLIEDDDGWFKVGDWHDTYQDIGAQAVVRIAPRVPDLATMVFHCHYLNHEDQGMMTYVDVEGGSETCTKGAQCAKSLDPLCYSDGTGAGFNLLDSARKLRR